MSRVLIAGCGYVGIAAAKLFRKEGWKVTAWTHSGEIGDPELAVDRRAVDLRDRKDVRRNSLPCDVVVHTASSGGKGADEYRRIYRDGVENLTAAFPGARIIFTSSTSVYPQRDGSWVDEDSSTEPATENGKILREAEEILLSFGGVVLRLAGIYGPGRSFLLQNVLDGKASFASQDRYVNQIHRDDIASAILLLAQGPLVAPTRIFNVVDDLPVSRREILTWLSQHLQKPLADSPETVERKRGNSSKRVSNKKLRFLGWSPRYPDYREGFLRSVLPACGRL